MIFAQAMQLVQDPQFLQDGEQVTQQPTAQSMPFDDHTPVPAPTPAPPSLVQGLADLSMAEVTTPPKDKGA